MASKYLKALSTDDYNNLTEKLWNIQNQVCFICNEKIDLQLHTITRVSLRAEHEQ